MGCSEPREKAGYLLWGRDWAPSVRSMMQRSPLQEQAGGAALIAGSSSPSVSELDASISVCERV